MFRWGPLLPQIYKILQKRQQNYHNHFESTLLD